MREAPSPLPAARFLEDAGLGSSQGTAAEEYKVRRLGSHFPHQDNEWFPKSQDSLVNLVLSFLGTVQDRGGAAATTAATTKHRALPQSRTLVTEGQSTALESSHFFRQAHHQACRMNE